ncbi:kinase-like domain-containing protein [Chiua virens]|nr:kinase-like domain-containing protein [Chiua virens]
MPEPQEQMNTDELEEQTQQATQSTQQESSLKEFERHIWGYLHPCNSLLRRADFYKVQPVVYVGRGEFNDLILPGAKVSTRHCRLVWDGVEHEKSAVVVADTSSNGTFINGNKIGKDKTAVLRDGNEIAFGTPVPQPASVEDYRFIFKLTAAIPTPPADAEGVHAMYDITHELGKGSFATVVKAISRKTGQWFAIKMIQESKVRRANANGKSDADKENAFMREIAILEELDHPYICKLKEVFRDRGKIGKCFFAIVVYVDGGDLLDYIVKKHRVDEGTAIHITRQLCDALAYIHAKGIAHRDLKPENVLLTAEDPPTVKVADFGLAKVVDSLTFLKVCCVVYFASNLPDRVRKTMCGTPNYLAPEVVTQTDQQPGYSHLVDSWSVGVIVFCMLTGTNPFIEDESQHDIKVRVATRTIDWDSLHCLPVSEYGEYKYVSTAAYKALLSVNIAKDFIRRLLEPDPRKRLSLSAACSHPWIKVPPSDAAGANNSREAQGTVSASASLACSSLTSLPDDEDEVMADLISHPSMSADMEMLHIDQHNQSPRSRARLQRRSQVLAHAAENNIDLLEPSQQMLDAAGAGPARAGKRKLNEHDSQPLSAVMEDGETMAPRRKGRARKKGKQTASSDAEDSTIGGEPSAPTPSRRGGRGRGRGRNNLSPEMKARLYEVATTNMIIEEDHLDDGTPLPKPRRTRRV